ncbi:MAG TPA: SusD/RagB family nutrient-binding outer membrane lipoprotein [Caldithrix abyssi]|uniref:SusD/RagB family nutrient-binding outer membrane lipoprotein n=1 Tax=Caldithrix abyssi TaxID=187145 RepID=A0A7V1PUK5_CALAY|nr:SusD/RagB family nutrient-binding outer membrane lipoprotein [Caldithrix abyssi]
MTRKNIISMVRVLFVFTAILFTTSCQNFLDADEVITDPNRVTEVTSDLLFNSVQVKGFFMFEGQLARTTTMWMQQMDGTDRQFAGFAQYEVTEGDHSGEMSGIYTGGGLIDMRKIQADSEAKGRREYAGIAKVWEALVIGMASSLWGDLPYSEAVNIESYPTPKLDKMSDIYAALQNKLDEAIADLQSGAGGYIPANDFVYGGDVNKWVEAAYTLKARLYMHWAEVDAANYGRALAAAQKGISSTANNFKTYHTTTEVESNGWYQFFKNRDSYLRSGRFLVELLKTRQDTVRLEQYFERLDGTSATGPTAFVGSDPNNSNASASSLSDIYLAKDLSTSILSWEETQLIIAEAAFKTGDEATALAKLNEVRANFNLPALSVSGSDLFTAIAEEKYVALFLNMEVYNDWKRTGYPESSSDFSSYSGLPIPRRLLYGSGERNANPNIPAPSQQPARNENDPS